MLRRLRSLWDRRRPQPLSSWFVVRWDDSAAMLSDFWTELVRRGLFDAELAMKAMATADGLAATRPSVVPAF